MYHMSIRTPDGRSVLEREAMDLSHLNFNAAFWPAGYSVVITSPEVQTVERNLRLKTRLAEVAVIDAAREVREAWAKGSLTDCMFEPMHRLRIALNLLEHPRPAAEVTWGAPTDI